LLVCGSRRNGWCCMHRHRFGVALSSVSGEDKSPLNITAGRTHESAVLVARDRHGVVLDYVHQVHLCAARKTTHRAYSIKRRSVGAVMMASSGCRAGYPQLVHRRHGNLRSCCFRATIGPPPHSITSSATRDAGPTPRLESISSPHETHRYVEIHCLIDGCFLGVATMVSIHRAVSLGP